MKAVVMAGGEGTRLRPLTSNRPKPLVPVCNRPVMEHIIDLLKKHGITQIVVTLHYLADEIVSYFGDGSDFGVQLIYSVEDEPLGTAGSVKKVETYLSDDTFLLISGDALTDFDLTKAVNFHKERGAMATVVLTRVENPLEFGVVITDEEDKIRRFVEKPSWGEVFSDTINTGIYVLEPDIFSYMEPGKVYDFSKHLFPALLEEEKPLYGYVTGGYWCDIGNLHQYRQAQQDLLQGKVKASCPGEQRERGLWVGEGSEISPEAELNRPLVIGRNCRIKAGVVLDEFTVIGDNCIVEEGSTIQRSVLWPNVYIGKSVRLNGVTLGRGTTVKNNAVVGEGVVIGDKCFIGQGSVIHPQVKIWPEKHVEAGATVSMSLIWGMKWPGSLFGEDGIGGLANIELTPDFALRLGAAYGASLDKGTTVTTSRDSHPASRMLNRAIICGLISVGVNVLDLRAMPTPLSRYAVKNSNAAGGIHSRVHPGDARSLLIEFYDRRGINIDKGTERKIENIFFREDFRRTSMDEVGRIDFPSRAVDQYVEGYVQALDVDLISRSGAKAVIDYAYGNTSLVLPLLLGKLGCETVAINAYLDAFKGREVQDNRAKALTQLSNIVTTLDARLGILMDLDGERLVLVDERGRMIAGNQLLAVLALMMSRSQPEAIVAVPITAPAALERLVGGEGGRVVRTRTDGRSLMHTASVGEQRIAFAGNEKGGVIFPAFQPTFDAMFAFGKLLELLARLDTPLSAFVDQIPPFHIYHRSVECVWQQKGKVMRQLIEENQGHPTELLEGLKVFREGGWIAVIPDPVEPTVHITAEAESEEGARVLVEEFASRVEHFKGGESLLVARMMENTRAVASKPLKKKRKQASGQDLTVLLTTDRSFHFWKYDHYLGIVAHSYAKFAEMLHYIDVASLEFHAERGDIARWVAAQFGLPEVVEALEALRAENLSGEALREALIKVVDSALPG